jgi:pyridoxamine 5'-phosphate oxidase
MSLRSTLKTVFTLGRGVAFGVPEHAATDDPFVLFDLWFKDATEAGLMLPEAMTLATSSRDGAPSARMVLLKEVDRHGFVFYTNYDSRKGAELTENPRAALVFHWTVLERQVRVEGVVARVTSEESYAYFRTRGRGSRIGAWASRQSATLESRDAFLERVRHYEKEFAGGDVPLPPFWGGFRVAPQRIEFWQGRANRLHDRLLYERNGEGWTRSRLYP